MILNDAENIMLGSRQVEKVCRGTQIIWQPRGLPRAYRKCKFLDFNRKQRFGFNFASFVGDRVVSVSRNFGNYTYNTIWGIPDTIELYYNPYPNQNVYSYYDGFSIEKQTLTDGHIEAVCLSKKAADNIFIGDYGAANSSFLFYGRIVDFYIMRGDKCVLRLIPCLDANGTPCFYDEVSKSTHYNIGSGVCGYETEDGTYAAPV